MSAYKNILLCTDLSEVGERALQRAKELALQNNATLHVLHVPASRRLYYYAPLPTDPVVAQRLVDQKKSEREKLRSQALHMMQKQYGPHLNDLSGWHCEVHCGRPAAEILRCAWKHHADLIVLGLGAEDGQEWDIIGNTTQEVLKNAHCPVENVQDQSTSKPVRSGMYETVPGSHSRPHAAV